MARKPKSMGEMDVTPKNLPDYLEQIHTFLVNNGKSFIFPSLTMAMENILVNIAKDTNYLMTIDDLDCKIWSKRILAVLEKNKEIYTLSYCFEDVLGKKVMVYKKKPVPVVFKEPLGLKLLRKPHSPNTQPASVDNTNTVMSSFKTTCLNATLKFVKNDKQLILQYPDISTEQADFVKHMISECLSPKDVSTTPGGRGMFDPLAEALKIFTTKYDFKLNNGVPDKDDMKRLYLEKKPKKIIIPSAVTKDISDDDTCSISSINSQEKSHQYLTQLIEKLDNVFTRKTILDIKQFLLNNEEKLEFTNLNKHQGQFLMYLKGILKSPEVLELLDHQDDLRLIKSLWMEKGVCKIKTYLQIVSPTERTVTFTRTLKKNPTVGVKTVADLNYPDLLSYCNIHTGPEKMPKRIQKFCNATNSLTDEWIETSLIQLNNFIQDDAQASLVIPNINDSQIAFLHKWKTFLGMKDVIALYNSTIQRLLLDIRIKMAEKKAPWRVACSSSKRKKDLTRDMTFMKYPDFDNMKSQKPSKTAPKVSINRAAIALKINTSKSEISTKILEPVKIDKGIPKSSSVTSLPVKKVQALPERGRPKSATVTAGLPRAKAKLIQGLSQPLVSERGIKMMRNMGWDGGALGLRGEGIVEPIALPLDLKKRAGLGCEKEQIKRPKRLTVPVMTSLPVNITRVPPYNPGKEFKTDILEIILDMVQEATSAMELPFTKNLTQKQWGFIKSSVISFNEGTKYMHDVPILKNLGHMIVKRLSNNNSILTACWGVSKTNILLVVAKAIYQPCDLDSTEWCSVVSFNNPKMDNMSLNTHNDNVIVDGEAFRYYVLAQILQFCDRPSIDKVPAKTSLTKEIVLKGTIVQKQMAYLKDVIIRLNNKSRASSDSDHENAVFNNIIDVINGFTLDVDFPIDKCTNENKTKRYKTILLKKIGVPNAPRIVQDAPTVGHAPKRCTPPNLPNLIDDVDCISCLPENIENNDENDVGIAVEYIFIVKETVESNIGGPIVTVTKDNEVTSVKTEDIYKYSKTISNLDTDIQKLSIKDDIDEKTENLVGLPEGTIYGLQLGNTESIQNIGNDCGKRPISNSSTPEKSCKKCRYGKFFKNIVITPKNYPLNSITDECAAKIQKSILGSIDYTDELPLLQCRGIQDGGLVYSCHTDKSLDFILNVIESLDLLVTVSPDSEIISHRMTVKIRSFIKESVDVIFDRLETYNINLDTRNWKVLDVERCRDFVIISVEVDDNSYKMIYREKFTLYTGIDQAKFSILWD